MVIAGIVFDKVVDYMAYLAGALVAFILLSVSVEIFSRKVFGYSIAWSMPLSEISLLYIAFLAAPWLLKREGHPSLDLIVNRLGPGGGARLTAFTSIVVSVLCLIVVWFSASTTLDLARRGIMLVSVVQIPKAPLVVIITIGSLVLAIQFIRRALEALASSKDPKAARDEETLAYESI